MKKIYKVCRECGIAANVLTCLKKYGQRPDKLCFTISTFHTAKCDVCKKTKPVTQPRDFFYLDFNLLVKYKTAYAKRTRTKLSRV